MCSCYCTLIYIGKFNSLRKIMPVKWSDDWQPDIFNKLPKTLSVQSLLQEHRPSSYFVSTGTTNGWSAEPGIPNLLQCFLHLHRTTSTVACFLPFSDPHNPNVPSSLRYAVPASVILYLQPHYFNPRSQGPMYSVRVYHNCKISQKTSFTYMK
jgi:hypothetical protein